MAQRDTSCEFYLDAASCRLAALDLGLHLGIPGTVSFDAPYITKGCYFYRRDHPSFPNQAFFGTMGTMEQMTQVKGLPHEQVRMFCNTTTTLPDPPKDLDCGYYDRESCLETATSLGLTIGSDGYPFAANYPIKGCFYFPRKVNGWPDTAHFGTGATTWEAMAAIFLTNPDEVSTRSIDSIELEPDHNIPVRINCDVIPEEIGDTCTIYDPSTCLKKAIELGLKPGNGAGLEFVDDYAIKGCFYFPAYDSKNPNTAFFGSGGTEESARIALNEAGEDGATSGLEQRLNCNTVVPTPLDDCHFYTSNDCRVAALEMGLAMGNREEDDGLQFLGKHEAKGCFYFSAVDPETPNVAYFGTGGTFEEMTDHPDVESTSTGPLRLNCLDLPDAPQELGPVPDSCGYYDQASCLLAILKLGLTAGGADFEFVGDYPTKGCYYYPGYHPDWPNLAFFGSAGSYDQMEETFETSENDQRRVDCNTIVEMPPAGDTCSYYTAEQCQAAARLHGIEVGGGGLDFIGEFPTKGCYYYPSDHPTYPNMAYFGVGGSSYADLIASPSRDQRRLNCETSNIGTNSGASQGGNVFGTNLSIINSLGIWWISAYLLWIAWSQKR